MIVTLDDIERVVQNVLTGNKPRFAVAELRAADTDTFALT